MQPADNSLVERPDAVPAAQAASELLTALAAPLRLSIIVLLERHGTRCVHQLVDELGMPQPLVSQHLGVLRRAGLVVGQRRHREVHYALVDPHVGDIVRAAVDHVTHAGPAGGEQAPGTSPDRRATDGGSRGR